jgi:branched-chain amino acid transport system ATP-binding protein
VTAPALELRAVEASYGPFRALFGVSLRVVAGSATAVLGANGAGKTTVARVATGLVPATAGAVLVDGNPVTGMPCHVLARRGVGHVVEGRSVFATLSVEDNLVMALRRRVPPTELSAAVAEAYELFPRLGERRRQQAGTLSGGEQRMLSLAWALVRPPKILVCDELSLGLAPSIVADVYRALSRVRDAGTALLVVEQQVHHALALADEAVVLAKGDVAWCGAPGDLEVDALLA